MWGLLYVAALGAVLLSLATTIWVALVCAATLVAFVYFVWTTK